MRRALPLVLSLALLVGCVEAGIGAIEDARERRREREEQESTESEEKEPFGPPTPEREATPAPTPRPIATPTPSPSPSPSPSPRPSPSSPPAPQPWPSEGSFARFEMWESDGARSWANWSYHGTDWSGRCVSTEGGSRVYSARDPPHWPIMDAREGLVVGGTVRAWYIDECRILSINATYDGMRDGRHVARALGFTTSWDPATGLVLDWERGTSFGRLASRG